MFIQCPLCLITLSSTDTKHHLLVDCTLFPCVQPQLPKMQDEYSRLQTFKGWTNHSSLIPALAQYGFFFTEKVDTVSCFWCLVKLKDWKLEDDPLERHINASYGCRWIVRQCTSLDVCLLCQTFVHSHQRHSQRCPARHIDSFDTFPRNSYMKNEYFRLKSFQTWPRTCPKATDMAKRGFYYTGTKDIVACFYCNVYLSRWNSNHDPLQRHVKYAPDCVFADWETKMSAINYSAMLLEQNRLNTFDTWPMQDHVNPKEMAEMGFFCLHKDFVQCVFCKMIIGPWEKNIKYNLLQSHIKKSPHCPFMQGINGNMENVPLVMRQLTPVQPDMVHPMKRLCTFYERQHHTSVSVFELARNGFYYTNEKAIRCFWCHFELKDNLENYLELHVKSRADCLYAQSVFKEERKETVSENNLCKICLMYESDVMFVPCHHLASCVLCANQISICCICRAPIQLKIKVFKC